MEDNKTASCRSWPSLASIFFMFTDCPVQIFWAIQKDTSLHWNVQLDSIGAEGPVSSTGGSNTDLACPCWNLEGVSCKMNKITEMDDKPFSSRVFLATVIASRTAVCISGSRIPVTIVIRFFISRVYGCDALGPCTCTREGFHTKMGSCILQLRRI